MADEPTGVVLTEQMVRELTADVSATVFAEAWEQALVAALGQLEAVRDSGTTVPYVAFARVEALRKTDEATFLRRLREREEAL